MLQSSNKNKQTLNCLIEHAEEELKVKLQNSIRLRSHSSLFHETALTPKVDIHQQECVSGQDKHMASSISLIGPVVTKIEPLKQCLFFMAILLSHNTFKF